MFYFKQKTAYELRISDWSSDVCSSDLETPAPENWRCARAASPCRAAGRRSRARACAAPGFCRGGRAAACALSSAPRTWLPAAAPRRPPPSRARSEEQTSELQSLMRSPYAVFCLTKTNKRHHIIIEQILEH